MPVGLAGILVLALAVRTAPGQERDSADRRDGTWEARAEGPFETDPRSKHPEYDSITIPPEGPVRVPGEWETVQAVLLDLPEDLGASIHRTLALLVQGAFREAEWHVLVPGPSLRRVVEDNLLSVGLSPAEIEERVRFLEFGTETLWITDFGPVPLLDGENRLAFVDFRYFRDRPLDDAVPSWLGRRWGVTTYRAPLHLEGGNLQVDGQGTCYATRRIWEANPDRTEAEIRQVIREYLGCDRLIVLVPLGDGTRHLDMFGRVVGRRTFLLGQGSPERNAPETIARLEQNASILEALVFPDGGRLRLLRIPMPFQKDGAWRTYTNAVIVNDVVVLPVYEIDRGLEAEAILAWEEALPGARIVPVESEGIIGWGGALHCIARTIPRGRLAKRVPDGTCEGGVCIAPEGAYRGTCREPDDCQGPAWVQDPLDDGPPVGDDAGEEVSSEGTSMADEVDAQESGSENVVNGREGILDPGDLGLGGPETPGTTEEPALGKVRATSGCGMVVRREGFHPGRKPATILVFAVAWMVYTTCRNRSCRETVLRAEGRSRR